MKHLFKVATLLVAFGTDHGFSSGRHEGAKELWSVPYIPLSLKKKAKG